MRIVTALAAAACALALALSAAPALGAGDAAGTSAAGFLTAGTGAGVLGMGGATQGLAGGLAAVPWNPASLGWLRDGEISLSHAGLEDVSRQEWLAFGGRFGQSRMRWSVEGLYQGDGSFDGRDAANNPTGGFDVSSMAFGAHLARTFGGVLSAGLGGKYVGQRLGSVNGTGFALDAGLQARAGMLGVGASVTNAGGHMRYDGESFPLPTSYGLGAALTVPLTGLRLALDADFPTDYWNDVRVGGEWRWHDTFALRAGYRAELGAPADVAQSGPSFGAGGGAHGVWLDYGYLIPAIGDGQHRLSLTVHPGALGWLTPDPLGQKKMPRDFESLDRQKQTAAPQPSGGGKKQGS